MSRRTNDWEWAILVSAGVVMLASSTLVRRSSRLWRGLGVVARNVLAPHPVAGRRYIPRDRMPFFRRQGAILREHVVLAKAAGPLFEFWRDLRNLPHVVSQLEHVELLEGTRARWTLRGPAGRRMTWDTRTVERPDEGVLAWESVPGSQLSAAAAVKFTPLSVESTDVEVVLQYEPLPTKLGESLIWLAGQSPSGLLREDLARLKQLLETGVADEQPEPAWLSHWIGGRKAVVS